MKLIVFTLMLWVNTSYLLAQSGQREGILIKNIHIIDVTSGNITPNKSVIITNGIIQDIVDNNHHTLTKANFVNIINGKGKFLIPGLSEMHVHLPEHGKLQDFFNKHLQFGITQIRVMNTEGNILKDREVINTKYGKMLPDIFYPFLFTDAFSFNDMQMDSVMQEIVRNKYDFIKLLSVKRKEIFLSLMQAAKKYNIMVCGHYPGMVPIQEVLPTGFRSIEHLAGYSKLDSTALFTAIESTRAHNIFHCPTVDYFSIALFLEQRDKKYLNRYSWQYASAKERHHWDTTYSGYTRDTTMKTVIKNNQQKGRDFYKNKIDLLRQLYANDCLLLLGSDPGGLYQLPGANMLDEALKWNEAGIDNLDILKAATINAAMFFKQEDKWGIIQKGCKANLAILNGNPLQNIKNLQAVHTTIINGNIAYQKTKTPK
jgi:imidazolonepropionase-like amidohydrolase